MHEMFAQSKFNGDIGKWKVSKVTNMSCMFAGFNLDGKIKYTPFNGDISKWDVSSVKDTTCMFTYSKFEGNLDSWKLKNVKGKKAMFAGSTLLKKNKLPKWFKK